MTWIRGLIFTVLVPGTVAVYVPMRMSDRLIAKGGWWEAGWILIAAGAAGYTLCLLRFLISGGTPAIFFTRPLRFLIGEEPRRLVEEGLYRVSRNPMYVSVLLVIFGQALRFGSWQIADYGLFMWLCFHFVVVLIEEPHLRDQQGRSYEDYCRRVPRWLLRVRAPGAGLHAVVAVILAAQAGCGDYTHVRVPGWRSSTIQTSKTMPADPARSLAARGIGPRLFNPGRT